MVRFWALKKPPLNLARGRTDGGVNMRVRSGIERSALALAVVVALNGCGENVAPVVPPPLVAAGACSHENTLDTVKELVTQNLAAGTLMRDP